MSPLPSKVTIADGAVSRELNGQRVLLNVKTGSYFGLDEVAARIWQLLESESQPPEISARITREYDVAREQCEQDLAALLQSLAESGLVILGR